MGENGEAEFNLNDPRSIQVGLSNMFRTGNAALDMIIAMSIPMLLKILMDSSGWLKIKFGQLMDHLYDNNPAFERHIVYEERRTSWGSVMTGRDQKNNGAPAARE